MNINGYELGEIAFMTGSGPLWSTTASTGRALVALRSAQDGAAGSDRWRAWARIKNRHVVRLIDVVADDAGRCAIIQERVEGRSLHSLIGAEELRPVEARRRIIDGLRSGVSALHAAGIIHGDLSPHNILIDKAGHPVIIDLIDEPRDGGGTPEWTLDLPTDEAGDRRALERIAAALDLKPRGSAPHPAATGSELALNSPATSDDLRTAAAAVPTVHETDRESGPRVALSRQRRQRRARLRIGATAGLCAASCVIAWLTIGAPADAARPQDSAGTACAEPLTELRRILSARDDAYTSGDESALSGVLADEALVKEGKRMRDLRAEGIRIDALRTTASHARIIECGQERLVVEADIRQELSTLCSPSCAESGPQATHRVRIALEGDPLKASSIDAQT